MCGAGVPFGRFGVLLVASGVVWLVATFSLADGAVVYSIGRLADWVGWAAVLYLVLVFPDGVWRDHSTAGWRSSSASRSPCCGSPDGGVGRALSDTGGVGDLLGECPLVTRSWWWVTSPR